MSYVAEMGLLQIATGYSGGSYSYSSFPFELVSADSYSSTPDQMQDLDSHVTSTGYLKRKVMPHTRSKIELNTGILTMAQKNQIVNLILTGTSLSDGKCSRNKRHVRLRYYDELTDGYSEGTFYVPDITFQYKLALNGEPLYQPIRIAFIET